MKKIKFKKIIEKMTDFRFLKHFRKKVFDEKDKKYLIVIILIIVIAWATVLKIIDIRQPRRVYEALVQVEDRTLPDPAEDKKASLKKGDVLVIFPEGHAWSDAEREGYLLLKLKLTDKEAQKLVQPEMREKNANKPYSVSADPASKNNKSSKKYIPPQHSEIIRARAYRVKIEKLKYNPTQFRTNQPYLNVILGKGMIERK
jgi:hypothetical protein